MPNAKAFGAMSLLVMAVSAGPSPRAVRVEAAGQPVTQAAEPSQTPSRALLDRYCVTCHNERLKTGGLMLDQVDLTRVEAHREALEKVARKLRSGQMPPPARPRPDDATGTRDAALSGPGRGNRYDARHPARGRPDDGEPFL